MRRETVLVVDDDEDSRRQCVAALERASFRVYEAPDGDAAVARMRDDPRLRNDCDLALVDYLMPGRNGFAVFHQLKLQRPDLAGILLTGHTSLKVAIEALNRNFSQVVAKPIDPSVLVEAVESALAERRGQLENARLRALARLYDSLSQLAAITDLEELYTCIVRLARSETSADSASLMLLEQRTRCLTIAAAEGLDDAVVEGVQKPLGEPISGWVLSHGVSLELAVGKPLPEAVRGALRREDVSAGLCIPLCPGGRPLGVLCLTRVGQLREFGPGDLEVGTVLASDAALSIERLSFLQEHRRRERIATVGRLASTIIHDLRGPVTIIGGAVEMLENTNPEARTELGRIQTEVVGLDRMCRQLLSFARERSTSATDVFAIGSLAAELEAEAGPTFEAAGVPLRCNAAVDAKVEAAHAELLQSLLDVLESARLAAKAGSAVTLTTALESDRAVLTIEGATNDPEGWWRELEEPAALAAGGAGLSLAVTRNVAERHRGQLVVEVDGEVYHICLLLPVCKQA